MTTSPPPGTTPIADDPDEIRRQIDATRADLAGNVDLLEEKVSPSRIVERRVGRVKSAAGGVRDSVMGTLHSGGDQASSTVHDAASSVKSAASGASDAVTNAPDTVTRQTQGNPLAAGLIAFGVGWLVGSLISPSDQERELAAEAKDRAQPALTDAAKHVAEQVKEPAQQAVADLKDTVTDKAQQVTEEAKSHASDVADDARGAVSDVQGQARS
ncbi:DUF3618 domain-containing protein [Jatrophihabitans sp. YIM 134969]